MDLAEDDALDSRAVAAAELAETAKTMSAPVQASAEKGASLASVGEPQEPITDVTAAPQNTSDPCEAPISPESVSSKNEGEESTTPANAPPAHDPAGPSTPPLESILSPPSKNPGQKDSFTSAHPSQEPSAPSNQVSGPLADFIPPPIPPFKQKSLPTAKPPSTTYRERSARFKRKRQAKQNGPQAFASGTAYPFHHSFRAIPGEKLPNGQSPYPGTAPPGAPLYSPLVAPPKGDFLNATALARLTGTYLGFPWLSIAVSGPPNLGAISQDGRARKKRMKGADTEAPRMVQESPPSSLMSFDTERKPRWKPAPEGFTKCAACVWSRRATGYCYLKHGGEQGGTRVKPVLANDGASEKDVPGDRSDGDDGGGRKSVRVERISADDGASEKDVGGERSEGEGREGPVKDADKGGEGGPSEAEGSETVPEKAPDGDKVRSRLSDAGTMDGERFSPCALQIEYLKGPFLTDPSVESVGSSFMRALASSSNISPR